MFCGYTLILILDKVLFDTHALLEPVNHDALTDPVDQKLAANIRASLANIEDAKRIGSPVDVRRSVSEAKLDIKQSFKEYLSSTDQFAVRLKASMQQNTDAEAGHQDCNYVANVNHLSDNLLEVNHLSDNLLEDEEKHVKAVIQYNEENDLQEKVKPKKQCCNATPYVLMIALSVHAAFEGLALGLQS